MLGCEQGLLSGESLRHWEGDLDADSLRRRRKLQCSHTIAITPQSLPPEDRPGQQQQL